MRFPGFDTIMILKFPDLNTLRLALLNGAIPANMAAAGAVAGFDGDTCLVETSASLSAANKNELKKIGVQVASARTTWPAGLEKTEVSSWAEILPLERDRKRRECFAGQTAPSNSRLCFNHARIQPCCPPTRCPRFRSLF